MKLRKTLLILLLCLMTVTIPVHAETLTENLPENTEQMEREEEVMTVNKMVLNIAISNGRKKNVAHVKAAMNLVNKSADMEYQVNLTVLKSVPNNISQYDALIIPGGGHVHPSFYGQKKNSLCIHKYNKRLDRLEMKLLARFSKAKKPVLGICRGAQLINVYFGGTLRQNIGIKHNYWTYHTCTTKKKSDLQKALGRKVKVICWHHQVCKKMGKKLIVTMRSKEGYCEAFRHKKLPIYGTQWHPEKMIRLHNKYKEVGEKYWKYFFGKVAGYKTTEPVYDQVIFTRTSPEENWTIQEQNNDIDDNTNSLQE